MNRLAVTPRVIPRAPLPRRTQRDRLLRALEVAEGRWPRVWRHMADKLVDYDLGRLDTLF